MSTCFPRIRYSNHSVLTHIFETIIYYMSRFGHIYKKYIHSTRLKNDLCIEHHRLAKFNKLPTEFAEK